MGLLVAVGNAAATGIVRAYLDSHAIARENANVKLPHSSADCRENHKAIVAFYTKHCIRQRFLNGTVKLELIALWLFSLTTLAHTRPSFFILLSLSLSPVCNMR